MQTGSSSPALRRSINAPSPGMEAVRKSQTSNLHRTATCNIPADSYLHIHRRDHTSISCSCLYRGWLNGPVTRDLQQKSGGLPADKIRMNKLRHTAIWRARGLRCALISAAPTFRVDVFLFELSCTGSGLGLATGHWPSLCRKSSTKCSQKGIRKPEEREAFDSSSPFYHI